MRIYSRGRSWLPKSVLFAEGNDSEGEESESSDRCEGGHGRETARGAEEGSTDTVKRDEEASFEGSFKQFQQ